MYVYIFIYIDICIYVYTYVPTIRYSVLYIAEQVRCIERIRHQVLPDVEFEVF